MQFLPDHEAASLRFVQLARCLSESAVWVTVRPSASTAPAASLPVGDSAGLFERAHAAHGGTEHGQVLAHHLPDDIEVDGQVAVCQAVPERVDLGLRYCGFSGLDRVA